MTEPPPPVPQSAADEPKAPPMSLAGRLLNIFATPGDVFDEVRATPSTTSNWLAPAFIFIFVSWICASIVLSQPALTQQLKDMMETSVRQRMEKTHVPKEQAEKMIETTGKITWIFTVAGSYAGPPVMAFISAFAWGLIVWLGGAKVYKGSFDFMKAVEVVGLANMISVLEVIVKTLLVLAVGNIFAAPNLALLVKDFNPQNPAHALLALVNVMTFWLLAVRSVGLARLARVSISKAAVWVFGIWAAYSGLLWGMGALANLVSKRVAGS